MTHARATTFFSFWARDTKQVETEELVANSPFQIGEKLVVCGFSVVLLADWMQPFLSLHSSHLASSSLMQV
jgi:hypothetical protein